MLKVIILLIIIGYLYYEFYYKSQKLKKEKIEKEQQLIQIINTGVLLEIIIDRKETFDKHKIKEFWDYFHYIASQENLLPYISFEIKSEKNEAKNINEVSFNIWTPLKFKDMLISKLKTIYPFITIKEISMENDYIPIIEDNLIFECTNLHLKENSLYPIKVEKDINFMETISHLLSTIDNQEKVIIQTIIKPYDNKEVLQEKLNNLIEGKEVEELTTREKIIKLIKEIIIFPILLLIMPSKKIVERHNNLFKTETKDYFELTSLEKEQIEKIQKKIKEPLFSVDIRILIATPYSRFKAQNLITQVLGCYGQLVGDNGFIEKPIEDIKNFMFNVKNRFLDVDFEENLLSTTEISAFTYLQGKFIDNNIKQIQTKIVEAPLNVGKQNIIGYSYRNGEKVMIGIDELARFRHMWLAGMTGVGKSVLIENMILNDIENNKGLIFIDPHGDSALSIIRKCSTRRSDIYYLDLSNINYPPVINLFEVFNTDYAKREQEKAQIVESFIIIFKRLFGSQNIGTNTEDILRNAAYAVLELPDGASILDVYLMITSQNYREYVLNYLDNKPALKQFWSVTFKKLEKDAKYQQQNLNAPLNKLRRFVNDPILAPIVCPKKSTINIKQIMDIGSVLIVNLSKGIVGELTSNVIGSILVSQVQISTMMRSGLPQYKKTPFFLYIDEFQNFIGGEGGAKSFESILSEARKYNLGLIVANQYINQLRSDNKDTMLSAILGNCGTIGVFRIGSQDAKFLEEEFINDGKGFNKTDLINLDKYTMAIKVMHDGVRSNPFTLFTLPPKETHKTADENKIKNYSIAILTQRKKDSEREIIERIKQWENLD